ncbi:MAG: hypothetical protein N3G80_02735 [Candidatus Micrarchaeota archaeon]|nr:hypothetical protein [Candidatus Micrarchaeota archaeon]
MQHQIRGVLFAFFLLIFVQLANAAGWYDNLYYWIALSVIIASAFLGIAYMIGSFFELKIVEAWTKIELQELVAGVLIAVFCVGLIASADMAASFLSGRQTGAAQYAIDAITKIREDGRYIYLKIATAYFNAAKYASYSYTAGVNLEVVSISVSQSPAAGLSPLVAELGAALDGVANYLLFLSAQKSFIIFFVNASAILLPVGIFLRCFSITRRIGGTILGGIIAASVIYPASFALSYEIYSTFSPNMVDMASKIDILSNIPNPPLTEVVCSPKTQTFIQSPVGIVINSLTSSIGGTAGGLISTFAKAVITGENGWAILICPPLFVLGVDFVTCWDMVARVFKLTKAFFALGMYPLLSLYGEIDVNYLIENAREYLLPTTAMFGVLTLIFSLLPIIIGLVAARNFIIYFGGEPQLYGLSKLV